MSDPVFPRLLAVALAAAWALPAIAADPTPPTVRREQQKVSTAAVEQTARFVTTSLRALTYQKLDPDAEQAMLSEVAGGLKRLTKEEMLQVFDHLDAAAKAPDAAGVSAEEKIAYEKHREVVAKLRGMMFKMETLRSLDEVAKRVGDAAKKQHELHLKSLRLDGAQNSNTRRRLDDLKREQIDAHTDASTDVDNLLKQVAKLKPRLSDEQRARVEAADLVGRGRQVVSTLDAGKQELLGNDFREAAKKQLAAARELQALAVALQSPADELLTLKDAREKIEQARRLEEALKAETENKPDIPRQRDDRARQDLQRDQTAKLAETQAKIEFDAREARKLLEPVSRELAAKLNPAEAEMRRAEEAIRKNEPQEATEAQAAAAEKLKAAREELDKRIEKAELAKADPLAATKLAIEKVEQVLKDQKDVKQQAKAAKENGEPRDAAAEAQAQVAKDADALAKQPLAANPEAKKALDEAAKATAAAAKDLAKADDTKAAIDQDKAVDALELAKKELGEQAAAIEKRRDEAAKLEKAAEQFDKLAAEQHKLADDAKGEKADSKELAAKQDALQTDTKKAGDAAKESAPDAAAKAEAAQTDQADAGQKLDAGTPKPAGESAEKAANELADAAKEARKQLAEKNAQEAAEQQALKPSEVNAAEAASQVAKAIDQANGAAAEAKAAQAAAQQGQPQDEHDPAAMKLADLQKKLAEKVGAADSAAHDSAKAAAESLAKSDINSAVAAQEAALGKLQAEAGKAEAGSKEAEAAGKLAGQQDALLTAAKALQKSAVANAAAKAALSQAQSQAPGAVKEQLDAARKQLDQAQENIESGKPSDAAKGQQKAVDKLSQALATLATAAEAQAKQGQGKPGESESAKGEPGGKPTPGDKPGEGEPGQKPGDESAQSGPAGTGDRKTFEADKKGASAGQLDKSKGGFIDLQKLERDKVQQALEAAFPAAFREMVKQYNLNIKKATPAKR